MSKPVQINSNQGFNLNPPTFAITLVFPEELPKAECFDTIFRVVPIDRLNGSSIYCTGGRFQGENVSIIRIASQESMELASAYHVLSGATELTDKLVKEIEFDKFKAKMNPVAKIAYHKIKWHREIPGMSKDSAAGSAPKIGQNQKDTALIPSISPYPASECTSCHNETHGEIFCPSCGRNQRKLSSIAVIFLVILIVVSGYQLLEALNVFPASMETAGEQAQPTSAITITLFVVQLTALFFSAFLLSRLRLVGFWVLCGAELLNFVEIFQHFDKNASGSSGYITLFLSPFVFIALAFFILRRDLIYMK